MVVDDDISGGLLLVPLFSSLNDEIGILSKSQLLLFNVATDNIDIA